VVPEDAWLWKGDKLDLRVSAHSAEGLDRAALTVELLRDVIPGKAQLVLSRPKKLTKLRATFAAPATSEGWGDYAMRVMFDAGYAKDDPAIALAAETRALENLARFTAEIAIHGHGATIDEAARTIVEKAGLDSTRAGDIALLAGATPGGGGAAVERLGLLELRDRTRERSGRKFRAKRLNDAIIAEGPVQVQVIKENVLSKQKRRWFWRFGR